jgi:hypothetical protein
MKPRGAYMPKPQKKGTSTKKKPVAKAAKKAVKKPGTSKKNSKQIAKKAVKAPSKNKIKTKKAAPKLVNKRKEPVAITPGRKSPAKKNTDIPNSTVALLAVLTLIFMIWSAAVFFANVTYPTSRAPTVERAENLASGAQLSFKINPEPKSTAVVGLTIEERTDNYTFENNS